MTVYRKSFPEETALLVHRLIEGSKDPNVLKRAQAVYCRAAFDLPLDQIAGLTGLGYLEKPDMKPAKWAKQGA